MISLIMVSAKRDYPYTDEVSKRFKGEKVHVFDPTMKCLLDQSSYDFELIVVDALYDKRRDYYNKLDYPFPIKHVSSQPNRWHENKMPGICTQYNKGLTYAEGEYTFFFNEGYVFRDDFINNLWNSCVKGYFPVVWFLHDWGDLQPEDKKVMHSPVNYDLCGFKGDNVTVEYRYFKSFTKGNRDLQSVLVPWNWWYTLSAVNTSVLVDELNGFDERFDGDNTLMDCDLGSRLELLGYKKYIAMFRDLFMIRLPDVSFGFWSKVVPKNRVSIKCNLPLIWLSRELKEKYANDRLLTEDDVSWMISNCDLKCSIPDKCDKFQHGFINKKDKDWKKHFDYWMRNQRIFNLKEEREQVLNNLESMEGTFVEP